MERARSQTFTQTWLYMKPRFTEKEAQFAKTIDLELNKCDLVDYTI